MRKRGLRGGMNLLELGSRKWEERVLENVVDSVKLRRINVRLGNP
jgi:hypothetical protein